MTMSKWRKNMGKRKRVIIINCKTKEGKSNKSSIVESATTSMNQVVRTFLRSTSPFDSLDLAPSQPSVRFRSTVTQDSWMTRGHRWSFTLHATTLGTTNNDDSSSRPQILCSFFMHFVCLSAFLPSSYISSSSQHNYR